MCVTASHTAAGGAARALLVTRDPEEPGATAEQARIAVTRSIGQTLDLLDRLSVAEANPGLWRRLSSMFGWR